MTYKAYNRTLRAICYAWTGCGGHWDGHVKANTECVNELAAAYHVAWTKSDERKKER